MDRRWFILAVSSLALGAALAPSDAAWAKDGGDDDGGDDHSGHGDGDDDGGDDHSGHGGGDDGGGGDDHSGHGGGDDEDHNGGEEGDGGSRDGSDDGDSTLSLDQMMRIFGRYGDMTVVDVALVRRSGDLEYKFKFIDGDGRVRNAFFDAHTGNPTR